MFNVMEKGQNLLSISMKLGWDIERVLDVVLRTLCTDCADTFSAVWLRVFCTPGASHRMQK